MTKGRWDRGGWRRGGAARVPARAGMGFFAFIFACVLAAAVSPFTAEVAAQGDALPSIIAKTAEEVRGDWGAPRYIKVAPHDGDRRYAYFTLREWEQLGQLYPASQGEDVYVVPEHNLQVHLRYQPVFDAQNRFEPEFRVTTITYVFDEPTPLGQVVDILPRAGEAVEPEGARWYRHGTGAASRTVFVHWPDFVHPATTALNPFRADPGITLFWELGLSVPAGEVDADTPVAYVIEHLEQFLYDADELQPVSNPYS